MAVAYASVFEPIKAILPLSAASCPLNLSADTLTSSSASGLAFHGVSVATVDAEKALDFVKAQISVIDETGAKPEESRAVVTEWITQNLKSIDLRFLTQHLTVSLGRVEDGDIFVKSMAMKPVLEGSPASYAITSAGAIISGPSFDTTEHIYRKALYKFLFETALSIPVALELPENYRVAARDVVSLSTELTLIGSTYWTNEDAIRSMLRAKVFGSKRVAVVRDLFDRHLKARPFLDSVLFALDSYSPVAINDAILGASNPKRRMVQEFTLDSQTGTYTITVNDMELGEYFSSLGFQILPVPASIATGPLSLLSLSNHKFIAYSAQAKLAEFYRTEACKIDPKFSTYEFAVLEDPASVHLDLLWSSVIAREPSTATSEENVALTHHKELPYVHKPFVPYRDDKLRQTTQKVLMVAPIGFLSSAQTALDNYFMTKTALPSYEVERLALAEYAGFHAALVSEGVNVTLFRNERFYEAPDAVFPNNWFSTHAPAEMAAGTGKTIDQVKSTFVIYPMKAPSRRAERREHIVTRLLPEYDTVENLTYFEYQGNSGVAFEGTGSLVLDRVHKIAYCALSQRADEHVLKIWCQKMGYTPCGFESFDAQGRAVYHTNVVMGVGSSVAVVCAESVKDDAQRKHLLESLGKYHEVVQITHGQMNNFCGNVIEVAGTNGARLFVMSSRAYAAFTPEQHEMIDRNVEKIVHAPVPTIEDIGGGGVRCMMGEIF